MLLLNVVEAAERRAGMEAAERQVGVEAAERRSGPGPAGAV
jgi:hypothetical protein